MTGLFLNYYTADCPIDSNFFGGMQLEAWFFDKTLMDFHRRKMNFVE
jgi:hypothetical protein